MLCHPEGAPVASTVKPDGGTTETRLRTKPGQLPVWGMCPRRQCVTVAECVMPQR